MPTKLQCTNRKNVLYCETWKHVSEAHSECSTTINKIIITESNRENTEKWKDTNLTKCLIIDYGIRKQEYLLHMCYAHIYIYTIMQNKGTTYRELVIVCHNASLVPNLTFIEKS